MKSRFVIGFHVVKMYAIFLMSLGCSQVNVDDAFLRASMNDTPCKDPSAAFICSFWRQDASPLT